MPYILHFAALGPGLECSLSCKRGFLSAFGIAALLFSYSAIARNKVIINHGSVINPKILHSSICANNETRHKPLTSF